ncbi:hypothetical protein [uncultured Gimesia sp.]|uniref:hypothetical protein n=1 Tax=uncultured Gimesia sp. TaxID=1678688 RepID=UPI00261F7C98|nr:hypothetical protein [uncultured Gimesia sp.]
MTASSSPPSPAGKTSGTKQPPQVETDQKKPTIKRSKRETISDDDPFDLERQQQTKKVIPLSRKPAKGKMFRVVCPMCDTPGFASPKVVGHEVKCRNPECLAPVFLVPDSNSQERNSKEESKTEDNKNSKLPLIATVVLAAVSLGGAYFYFTSVEDSSELSKPFDNPIINQASQKSFRPEKNNTQVNSKNNNQQASNKTKEALLSPALVQQEALESIVKLSRSRENRSKPFSRRLAAEAYAISGKIKQAQEQIGRIDAVKPLLPFYKMFPLVEIGWIQLREKEGSDLKKTLLETEQLSKQIPEYGGRDSLDLVARLAAFWIAAGKEQQAVELVKKYQAKSNLAQLSAYLQIAHESNQYNFDSLIDLHQRWDSPQWVAVTLILIARDYPQEALNWAALAPEPIVRTEAITQWALSQVEHAVKAKKKPEITLIQPIEMKLSATGNSYVYASCARKLILLKQPEAARTYLNKATSFLKNTAIPAPITLGDIKSVNKLTLPVARPLEMLAHAYLQIACTESGLGLKAEATKSLNNAVQSIRAIAPSVVAVQNKINETSNFNFQSDIKEALNLGSSDRVTMGVNNYRKKLRNLKSSADKRLILLVKLLSEASRSKLEIDVWKIALQSQKSSNDNLNDPLLKSSLPAVIIQSVGQKNNELISKIKETVNENVPALSQEDTLIHQATSLIKNGKPEQAAHEINQSEIKKPWKGQLSLKLLSYLLSQSEYNQAIQFITAIKDPVLREDMLNTIGAVSALHGTISPIKKVLDSNVYTPTERISGLLGLISGIESSENQQTGISTPQDQSKSL